MVKPFHVEVAPKRGQNPGSAPGEMFPHFCTILWDGCRTTRLDRLPVASITAVVRVFLVVNIA